MLNKEIVEIYRKELQTMGQRCCILLKKNYKDKSTVSLIHHQWGIGKVLPALLLQEILRADYNLDRQMEYSWRDDGRLPIDDLYTFKPLNSKGNNYITDRVVPKEENVFDIETIKKYFNQTDNNNGGFVIEVTQNYKEDGKARTYGDMLDVKFAFVLGYEECSIWNKFFQVSVPLEEPFSRLVSVEEFACRTFGEREEDIQKDTKRFIRGFRNVCKCLGIKEVYNKEMAKEMKFKIQRIETELNLLQKKQEETGITQQIPKEYLRQPVAYA